MIGQSHLPQRRSLVILGVPRQILYRGPDSFRTGGSQALAHKPFRPHRVGNRVPDAAQRRFIDLAPNKKLSFPARKLSRAKRMGDRRIHATHTGRRTFRVVPDSADHRKEIRARPHQGGAIGGGNATDSN